MSNDISASSAATASIARIWLADLTSTQQTVAAVLAPYAIGCIAAYAEATLGLSSPIRLFRYPEDLGRALEEDGFPDIIGFSHYVWNGALAREFAAMIKRRSPRTITVFGGPSYPCQEKERALFLQQHPEIDFYIVKEGEAAFSRLIAALADANGDADGVKRQDLASVHAIDSDGTPHLPEEQTRLRSLSDIPSPYLDGRLDPFFDGALVPSCRRTGAAPLPAPIAWRGKDTIARCSENPARPFLQSWTI